MSSTFAWRSALASFLGFTHQGKRDLYEVFGYPRQVTAQELYGLYSRNGVANRIIRSFPQATWRDYPCIRDEAGDSSEKDGDSYSEFYATTEQFFEERNVLRALERADRLASIGRFGVLVMGFRDGKRLNEPLEDGKHQLLYLQPYGEPNAVVNAWDQDETSPRFGKPVSYTVQTGALSVGDRPTPRRSFQVHWTRVLHIAEFLDEDEVYGLPRLLPPYNDLLALEKVVGGAAETFWLTANRGLMLSADKEARLTDADVTAMKEQAEEFQHQLRRNLVGTGITPHVLGSEDPDPGPNVDKLLDLIAGAVGIPKRILIGSERGELSSAQDENNWSARIDERRRNFGTPSILRPFVNRMIATGNLPEPEGQWWIEWPEIGALGPVEESTVLLNRTNALVTYANSPGAGLVVPEQEFRRDFLNMEPESEYEIEEPEELPEEIEPEPEPESRTNAKPRALYVYRQVLNAKEILRWAKSQGFADLLPAEDLHVTIAYSKTPIDWMKIGGPWAPVNADDTGRLMIPTGGVRLVEPLGEDGLIVLMFVHNDLTWRHEQIRAAGAEWRYPSYQPHTSFARSADGVNLDLVQPYTGPIALGPEVFQDITDAAAA